MGGHFSWIDYSVVAVYIVLSVIIGLRTSKKQKNAEDYFLGGRKQPWFPVAISIICADLSAVSYMGVPGWVYEKDLAYFMPVVMLPLIVYFIVRAFIPIYRKLELLSIYEYLEKRYNLFVRAFTAFLFVLLRGGHLATAIYVPSLALQEMAGIPLIPSIAIIGTVVTLYTLKGGMRAVIWTDFMQFFVLIGGGIVMVLFALSALNWDLSLMWQTAAPHTRMIHLGLNDEISFWALIPYLILYYLTTYATDQAIAQRYFTTGSEAETRKAMLTSAWISLPVVGLLLLMGVVLVAYYKANPALAATLPRADRILPHFAVNVLPIGLKGLVIAGIFAATMSTLSAGLNSLSAVLIKDFFVRFKISQREDQELGHARWVTFACGVLLTLTAFYINKLGPVVEIVGKLGGFFMGPICATFTLGVISRRANSPGIIIGGVVGLSLTLWVANYTMISWLWWIVVGFLGTIIVGWACSWLFEKPADDLVSTYTMRT